MDPAILVKDPAELYQSIALAVAWLLLPVVVTVLRFLPPVGPLAKVPHFTVETDRRRTLIIRTALSPLVFLVSMAVWIYGCSLFDDVPFRTLVTGAGAVSGAACIAFTQFTLGEKTGPAARKARNARYGPIVGSLVAGTVMVAESGFAIAVGGGLVMVAMFVALFWDRE